MPDKARESPATGKAQSSRETLLSLSEVKDALFNGDKMKDEIDALDALQDKERVVQAVKNNPIFKEKLGASDKKLYDQVGRLQEIYKDRISVLKSRNLFKEKIEKESWGKWALRKGKEILTYPVRHPVKTVLIIALLAALGVGGMYLYNYLQGVNVGIIAEKLRRVIGLEEGLHLPMTEKAAEISFDAGRPADILGTAEEAAKALNIKLPPQ